MLESVFFYLYNKLTNNKFALIFCFFILKMFISEAQISDKNILDSLQKLEARITPKGLKDQHPFQSFITLRPVSDKDSVALELAEYQYENGARVFLMNTPYEKNVIHLKAISWGGYSLYDDEEDRKLVYSSPFVAQELGVGNLSREELEYLLSGIKGENNKIDFKINELNEEMNIQFGGEQFEPILKVIYNYFTNFTTQNKQFLLKGEDNTRLYKLYKNNFKMSKADSILMLFENEHLIEKSCNFPSLTNPEKFARAHQLLKERFADGGDFTFVFVGDFSKAQNMVGVFNKYIGNLPKDDKGEFCKFLPNALKKIDNIDFKGDTLFNRPIAIFHYEDSILYSAENIINAFYMTKLYNYQLRLASKKVDLGKLALSSAYFNTIHYPFSKLIFNITFESMSVTEYKNWDKIVENKIIEIQNKPLTHNEIEEINQYILSLYYNRRYENSNIYLEYLTQNIMEGLELDKLFKRGEFEAYLKTFTPEKIQQLAKQYWNVERRTKISQN